MKSPIEELKERLRDKKRLAIALSGGTDSSVLVALCAETIGVQNCETFRIYSPYMPKSEGLRAERLCLKLGVKLNKIEYSIPEAIAENPKNRCYLCKSVIFRKLKEASEKAGFGILADGTNADDIGDFRPGMKALKELGIYSPMLECGVGKNEIESEAERLGVEKCPPCACLMTRLEHGMRATKCLLSKIDKAEDFLRELGFNQIRVRIHGDMCARIETDSPEKLFKMRDEINDKLVKEIGFKYVCADMGGYRRGSMNDEKI